MLNIRTRAVAQTLTFDLLDEADQPLVDPATGKVATCTIHGPGSRRYVNAQAKRQSLLLGKVQKGKSAALNGDEQLRAQAEFLADITDEIDLDYDGLQGREKLLAIFGDPEIGFIAEQVLRKSGDWGNFSSGSAKS